jgi:hypothetical protein
MTDPTHAEIERRLAALYQAFNAREIDAVLAHLAADVAWPNAWEGGRVRGHDEVRDYWTRQWRAIDPTVVPYGFAWRPDGTVAVDVRQVVRGRDGQLVADTRVVHVYRLRDGLIARMEVEEEA